jgi:hypothetical protein
VKTDPFSPFDSDYNYLYTDNDSVSFIGHWANGGGTEIFEDHCNDFIKELSFPFTYPSAYVDSFQRFFFDMSGSDEHYITGTISVTAEGYGTLITPDGTLLQNIIKIHSVESQRDSNHVFGITNSMRHYYQWFSSDTKGFILRFDMSTADSTLIVNALYQRQTNILSSIHNPYSSGLSLSIFPNPCSGNFNLISPFKNGNGTIEIYNATGQQVLYETKISLGRYEIDLSNQPDGMYFVKLFSDEGQVVEKIFLQK